MGSRGEVPCQGDGDEIPNVTHARSANKKARIGAEPKATITILMHFDRTLLWIPTGCALRWAQRDWGDSDFPPSPSGLPFPLKTAKASRPWTRGCVAALRAKQILFLFNSLFLN